MNSIFKLKAYLRPHLSFILLSTSLAIPLSLLRLGPAPIVRYMMDDVLIHRDRKRLLFFALGIIGVYIANFVVRFIHYFLLRIVVNRVDAKIKNQIFKHLLGLSADYFSIQNTGSLISRTIADPQYIIAGLSSINLFIREPFTLLALFIYVLQMNWQLTLITVLVIPALAWVFSNTGKNLKRYIARLNDINARLYSTLQESYTGIRIVKMFGLEDYLEKKFEEINHTYTQGMIKIACLEEAAHPFVELLTACALAPIVYYGGLQVITGSMTTGELFAFFTAFALMINPIRMLNDLNMKLHQTAAACDRVFDLFNWTSHLPESPQAKSLITIQNQINFKNVSFAYPDQPNRMILKNLNFTIPCGQAIAIVGPSGTGKSSLISLLPRVFDVTTGSIQIDGQDIRDLKLNTLRSQIAIVSQDVFLFNDTIEQNIRCGRLNASLEEIEEAAKQAHAYEFIQTLEHGFQTVIGERGQKLSGGEKQRISIARAFLRQAPILILDEATSNLDTISERYVQEALATLMINRTTLIIAHRLTTIQNAKTIFFLKKGEIIETGNHDSLLALQGEYAKAYQIGKHHP